MTVWIMTTMNGRLKKRIMFREHAFDIFDGLDDKRLFKGGAEGFPGCTLTKMTEPAIGTLMWLCPVMITFRPFSGSSACF